MGQELISEVEDNEKVQQDVVDTATELDDVEDAKEEVVLKAEQPKNLDATQKVSQRMRCIS